MATRLKEVDAVMVGVGWTGSILARELTKAGLSVVGLERGPCGKPRGGLNHFALERLWSPRLLRCSQERWRVSSQRLLAWLPRIAISRKRDWDILPSDCHFQ